ncbi:MAG: hypothetical protein NWE89_15245 [Candidatus Bathyarchaeota archaeon]|nr:hypothetical protein [Candidatus Bathyarchaeota archaeon]
MEQRNLLAVHSYKELIDLLLWFHHQGPIPIIIGGWAVYSYNSYLGSVDIDLVGPSMGGLFDATLEGFERERDYQAVISGPFYLGTAFRKPIYDSDEIIGYMEIDACTYENDPRVFHENSSKELPYSLCDRTGLVIDVTLEKNCEARIPNKSLLFLYKLKELRDRQFDVQDKAGVLGAERLAWLRSKIIKDGSDLISILDPKPDSYLVEQTIDPAIMRELIQEFGLEFCLESISYLPLMETSCVQYRNVNSSKVHQWVSELLSQIQI